jgi:hypothetical protein
MFSDLTSYASKSLHDGGFLIWEWVKK